MGSIMVEGPEDMEGQKVAGLGSSSRRWTGDDPFDMLVELCDGIERLKQELTHAQAEIHRLRDFAANSLSQKMNAIAELERVQQAEHLAWKERTQTPGDVLATLDLTERHVGTKQKTDPSSRRGMEDQHIQDQRNLGKENFPGEVSAKNKETVGGSDGDAVGDITDMLHVQVEYRTTLLDCAAADSPTKPYGNKGRNTKGGADWETMELKMDEDLPKLTEQVRKRTKETSTSTPQKAGTKKQCVQQGTLSRTRADEVATKQHPPAKQLPMSPAVRRFKTSGADDGGTPLGTASPASVKSGTQDTPVVGHKKRGRPRKKVEPAC